MRTASFSFIFCARVTGHVVVVDPFCCRFYDRVGTIVLPRFPRGEAFSYIRLNMADNIMA